MFSTVIDAAPMKRCSSLAGVVTAYSDAVTSTTESWLMAPQLKFSVTRPWNGPQSEVREQRCPHTPSVPPCLRPKGQ
ncbi:hypothetical protein JJ691_04160 [Kutzneria sp. CA-103260]|nr:hypothetical protein JJ691_04160 [Kutzneria sp. CA-103260]